jgi:hypothetical protein
MNYRGRQVKLMRERDLAKKSQEWVNKEQTYKQDIIALQNSTDAKIIERLEQDLNLILNKWSWDGQNPKNAEEFLNKFVPWVNEQIENKKTWTKEIKELKEEVKDKDQLKDKLQFYTDNLKTKESIISEYQQELKEKDQNLANLKSQKEHLTQKTSDLETQLLNLAKQKLKGKKEAQTLLTQIEAQWKEKQEQWEAQTQQQQDHAAQTLAQNKADHQEEIKALNQKHQQEQTQAVQQTQEQAEQTLKETKDHFETQISSLELKLEVSSRELEEKQTKITELTQWSEGQHNRIVELETAERNLGQEKDTLAREKQAAREAHQTNLQEQKTFFETKVQGLENQLQTHQQTITNLTQQLQAKEESLTLLTQQNRTHQETIRTQTNRITQLEEYLRESQQDQQTKQTQITQLNQTNTNLQTRITELTQAQTEQTRVNNEQEETLTNLNQTLTRQRTVLERLLADREELTQQDNRNVLKDFKAWLETQNLFNKQSLPSFFEMVSRNGIKLEQFATTDWGHYHYQTLGRDVTQFLPKWKAEKLHQEITLIKEVLNE